jgi:hypothetical protein
MTRPSYQPTFFSTHAIPNTSPSTIFLNFRLRSPSRDGGASRSRSEPFHLTSTSSPQTPRGAGTCASYSYYQGLANTSLSSTTTNAGKSELSQDRRQQQSRSSGYITTQPQQQQHLRQPSSALSCSYSMQPSVGVPGQEAAENVDHWAREQPDYSETALEEKWISYQRQLGTVFQNITNGALESASETLLTISDWLLSQVLDLGTYET